jgi:two-component system, chemotaxis family, protein-glutamate methylesterase/glutaminase
MPKIRVLVVDDAVVFRRLIADELSKDPALEVAGTAANGKIALAKMEQVSPNLVLLDVEMPEMDGLETLKALRKNYPRLPVIMFSALTERGARATLDALALGATDYFTKPVSTNGAEASLKVIREELIPRIKDLCAHMQCTADAPSVRIAPAETLRFRPRQPRPCTCPIEVLAIGASTGGPNALAEVFAHIPADFPVPIVIVQHMPPMFTRLLAERLSAEHRVPVAEATSGAVLQAGHALIAPGNFHMIVVREGMRVRTLLHQDPPENSCRPSVDVLFRSVAASFGAGTLAVVLTGMGQDGLHGSESIREAGGQILAQDEHSSVVWGMPGAVARAGLADRVLPLSLVGSEIVARVRSRSTAP